MPNKDSINREVKRWKADFEELGDGSFEHFYCPILLRDENVELCRGHIVNKAIPNCCRKTVIQRKDIDGFYGSLLESHFATAIKAKQTVAASMIFDAVLRREIPWTIKVDGREIEVYDPTKGKSPSHPTVQIQSGTGSVLNLAMKIAEGELPSAGSLNVIVDRSYVPEATASLLKAAHLTMFEIFGYRHIFCPSGLMVAEILRTFYEENAGRPRKDQASAAKEYFPKHAGMIIPLGGYSKELLRGSIEDRRFIVCVGSSGSWYALGVFVRTDETMHIVLMPPDDARHMDTYFSLIADMYKKEFKFQFLDFSPANENDGAHWTGYRREYEFQPGPPAAA